MPFHPVSASEFEKAWEELGPLCHLAKRDERVRAIRESCHVLKPGSFLYHIAVGRKA